MKPTNEQTHVNDAGMMESLMLKGISTSINSMAFPKIRNLNEMLNGFGYTVQKKSNLEAEKLVERYSHWVISELQPNNIKAFINLILDFTPEEKELMLLKNSGLKEGDLWIVKPMTNNQKVGVSPSMICRHLGKTYNIEEMKVFTSLKELDDFLNNLDISIIVYSFNTLSPDKYGYSLTYVEIPKITKDELLEATYESVLTEDTTKLTRITFEYYRQNSDYYKDGYPAYYSILDEKSKKQYVHTERIPLEFRYSYEEELVNRKLKGHIPDEKQFREWLSNIKERDVTKTPDEKKEMPELMKAYISSKESLDKKHYEGALNTRRTENANVNLLTLYDAKEKYHILLDNFISYLINDEKSDLTEEQNIKILFVLNMISINPHVGVSILPIFQHSGEFYSVGEREFKDFYDLTGFIHTLNHDIIAYNLEINDKDDSVILRYCKV